MPDLTTIQNKVNLGKAYYMQLLTAELVKFKKGYGDTKIVLSLGRLVRGLTFQLDSEINDSDTTTLYNCLMKLLGGFSGSYVLDPDVIIPGQTTVIIQQVVGYNEAKIPFVVTESNPVIQLDNYHELYYPLYGNNPDLALYDQQGQPLVGDQQTVPTIIYENDDYTSNILSISWSYPPIPDVTITGYVRIAGIAPNSGGSGSGGGSSPYQPTTLTYSETDLLEDGVDSGNWYLPLTLIGNRVPVLVTSNGETFGGTFNTTFTPPRYYGFSNNSTQVIKVTIV